MCQSGRGNITKDKSLIDFGSGGASQRKYLGEGLSCFRILYVPNLIHFAEIAITSSPRKLYSNFLSGRWKEGSGSNLLIQILVKQSWWLDRGNFDHKLWVRILTWRTTWWTGGGPCKRLEWESKCTTYYTTLQFTGPYKIILNPDYIIIS